MSKSRNFARMISPKWWNAIVDDDVNNDIADLIAQINSNGYLPCSIDVDFDAATTSEAYHYEYIVKQIDR